jgi:TonB family protein
MNFFDNAADRLYRKFLQVSLVFYLGVAIAVTWIHFPERVEEGAPHRIPDRIARLMLETPKPQIPSAVPMESKKPKESEPASQKAPKEKTTPSKPSSKQVREMVKKSGLLAALIQEEKQGGLDSLIRKPAPGPISDSQLITAKKSGPARPAFRDAAPASAGLSEQKLQETASALRGERVALGEKGKTVLPELPAGGGTGGPLVRSMETGGSVQVKGAGSAAIDYDAIARAVEQYKGGLIYLYNKELRKNPTLKGTITVEFSIDPSGKVIEARLVSSTMEHPPLEEALRDRILHWKFPRLFDGMIVVTYPFVFFPV